MVMTMVDERNLSTPIFSNLEFMVGLLNKRVVKMFLAYHF